MLVPCSVEEKSDCDDDNDDGDGGDGDGDGDGDDDNDGNRKYRNSMIWLVVCSQVFSALNNRWYRLILRNEQSETSFRVCHFSCVAF